MKLLARNPFPYRIQNLIHENVPLRGLFSFYWPFLFLGFDRINRKTSKKMLFIGSSYKMPKVKTIV